MLFLTLFPSNKVDFIPIYLFDSYLLSHSNPNTFSWADHPSFLNTWDVYGFGDTCLWTHEIYKDWWHLPLKSTLMYVKYKLYNVKLSIHMLFTVIHVAVFLANLLISHFPHVSSSRIPYNKSTNSQTGSRPETPTGFLLIPPSYIAMPRILFNEILSNEEMNDEWALYLSFGVSPLANDWLNM